MRSTRAAVSSKSLTTFAQMSDAFNQPLSDVAEAQYQTISSQFVTAADRANILTAANQLAKVTAQESF